MKRPPIVVVMGHVDHGKTTLLDYIRKTNIAAREAGAITQSVGAYEIVWNGRKITFIDTPGHEAFVKMRKESAGVADIAILVVAADEGVKPQTKDALLHILEAKIPYIVAINKIDKAGADVEKTKHDLSQNGVYLEGFGGNISWQAISAKTGEGVAELLDLILLAADLENLEYDPKAPASGFVIRSELDSRRGIVADVILKNGTLKKGQEIFTPTAKGKVKLLENFLGRSVFELEPSAPARILGFENLPRPGEEFSGQPSFEIDKPKTADKKEIPQEGIKVIIGADEIGSLSALEHLIGNIDTKLPLIVMEKRVGDIRESHVKLAVTAGAIIIGFRVKIDKAALNLARSAAVKIITSEIIYELEKEIKEFVSEAAQPKRFVEILATFGERDRRQIVGGRVISGPIRNQEHFKISRSEKIVGEGKIINLQSQRKDVTEAPAGVEVGLLVESSVKIERGDKIMFE